MRLWVTNEPRGTWVEMRFLILAGVSALWSSLTTPVLGSTRGVKDNQDSIPYTPIVVPLAVRGPYLGAYLTGRQDKNIATMSPHFWTTSPIGWQGLVRVDGKVWNWMGNLTDFPAALNSSYTHTSSLTSFVLHAGGQDPSSPTVALTANFLSPITPDDFLRQSIPFSYLEIEVESLDGEDHEIEVYSDVNGFWCADEEEEILEWDVLGDLAGISTTGQQVAEVKSSKDWRGIKFGLQNQRPFQEENDRILNGEVYYIVRHGGVGGSGNGGIVGPETSFAVGEDSTATRRLFASRGSLANSINGTFRATRTRTKYGNTGDIVDEPVFAFSHAFGVVSSATSLKARSVLLAIGHVRDPIVQYMTKGEITVPLRPLWASEFDSITKMIDFVMEDYEKVSRMSDAWNRQLYQDARRVHSQEYGHVLAVSTRQVLMAIEAAWDESVTDDGNREASDAGLRMASKSMHMLKEISSNGNCQTVDVLAPFLPFLVYASPALLTSLLKPIFTYVATGLYRPVPPPHDIGDRYPNATGRNDFLYPGLPLEESGNMLNMALAAVQMGETAQSEQYYDRMKTWAQFLEAEGLFPHKQRSTDDWFGESSNQTSLVIKSMTGLRSMAELSHRFERWEDRDHYLNVTEKFLNTFMKFAISEKKDGEGYPRLLGQYGNQSSWVTQYNLFYDKLLGYRIFPEEVYDMQDQFYPTIAEPFGPPLDSRWTARAKTDWLMWAAAASTLSTTRDLFVNAVAKYFRQDKNAVFGDSITPQEGWSVGFLSRPVAGGHYSLLALDVMDRRRKEAVRVSTPLSKSLLPEDLSQRKLLLWVLGLGSLAVIGVMMADRRRREKWGYAVIETDFESNAPPVGNSHRPVLPMSQVHRRTPSRPS